jgi:hypothetical protein
MVRYQRAEGTPTEIVDKPNREINAALVHPKLKARLADLGGAAIGVHLPT